MKTFFQLFARQCNQSTSIDVSGEISFSELEDVRMFERSKGCRRRHLLSKPFQGKICTFRGQTIFYSDPKNCEFEIFAKFLDVIWRGIEL